MKIHPRTSKIIIYLCHSESYVTMAEIAQSVGVSVKTIVRELPLVENILKDYALSLDKKTGLGLCIRENMERRRNILKNISEQEEVSVYEPFERHSVLISRLLQQQEPMKLFELASFLKVTEGTISNDLDKLEPWFLKHKLHLVRKPGLGVYVAGEEIFIRKAIVEYIYENINEEELLEIVFDHLSAAEKKGALRQGIDTHLFQLVDKKIIEKLEQAVREMEQKKSYRLSDHAFVGLVVHLTLAVQRLRQNEKIETKPAFLAELQRKNEYKIAAFLAEQIAGIFSIQVPDAEVGYITMHLLGARNSYSSENTSSNIIDNFHLVKIAKNIMQVAEKSTAMAIGSNERLLVGLVNHLGPAISRLKMNMDIRNPLLADMKKQYPELLLLSKECVQALEEELGLELPDSELAYIAMHLGAALEESKPSAEEVHKVVVACPTGMGTSRMLASRLRKEYRNLQIAELISAVHLDGQALRDAQVEFIISTIPIPHTDLPVLVVNSLLLEDDRKKIDLYLRAQSGRIPQKQSAGKKPVRAFKEDIHELQQYSAAIFELLDSFFFGEASAQTLDEICEQAALLAVSDAAQQKQIKDALLQRERYGGTLIKGNQMILLHCRSEAMTHLAFGILHLEKYFHKTEESGEPVKTAIVMLAPSSANPVQLETIGYISSILLERWGLIEILQEGNKIFIYKELEKIFREFYQKKYKMIMEGLQ